MVNHGSGSFEVLLEKSTEHDNPKLLVTGTIYVPFDNLSIENQTKEKENCVQISGDEFYKLLSEIGYELEDDFNNVQEVSMNDKGKFMATINFLIQLYCPTKPKRVVYKFLDFRFFLECMKTD